MMSKPSDQPSQVTRPPHRLASSHPSSLPRAINLTLFLLGLAILLFVINAFAQRPDFRARIDATKTRAYSLSLQTRKLLSSLHGEGQWTIAIVMGEKTGGVDRAVRRQFDEVLGRYTQASPQLEIVRIDPADPRSLPEYEEMLGRLHEIYGQSIAAYDTALDNGSAAFEELRLFAQRQSNLLAQVLARMTADDPTRAQLEQLIGMLVRLAEQGGEVSAAISNARRIDQAQPIADYETARSILVHALTEWSAELDLAGDLFTRWQNRSDLHTSVRQFAASARREFDDMALKLAEAADPLRQLPEMELSEIGRQLQQGEAAVIISPSRAAVIPSRQLFPRNPQRESGEVVTFDQRFRGEQIITSTMHSLLVEQMPLVVFVHADDSSMLRRREGLNDLVGAASMLMGSRFQVIEWMIAQQPQRPAIDAGRPVVWVLLPPPRIRPGLSKPEQAMLDASTQLIDEGAAVMLNLYPSGVARYDQPDPWADLASAFGVKVDSSQVICEAVRTDSGRREASVRLQIDRYDSDHPLARAANGLRAEFVYPLVARITQSGTPALRAGSSSSSETEDAPRAHVIVEIQPSPDRWLESEWMDLAAADLAPEGKRLKEPAPIMIAVQRDEQRIIIVGSAHWLLSSIADRSASLGGGRAALLNPGNYELILASTAWLAGMDDLIAASPLSQSASTIRNLPDRTRNVWRWIISAGLPVISLAIGVVVYVARRR